MQLRIGQLVPELLQRLAGKSFYKVWLKALANCNAGRGNNSRRALTPIEHLFTQNKPRRCHTELLKYTRHAFSWLPREKPRGNQSSYYADTGSTDNRPFLTTTKLRLPTPEATRQILRKMQDKFNKGIGNHYHLTEQS